MVAWDLAAAAVSPTYVPHRDRTQASALGVGLGVGSEPFETS